MGRDEFDRPKKVPIYWKYIPAVINTCLIIIFGRIYKIISTKLVIAENHRYESEFENSIANKTYLFNFVNTYISNFVVICYNQNFSSLATNLIIVMIGKQVVINSYEYLSERISIGGKIRKSDDLFVSRLEEAKMNEDTLQVAHIKMHKEINQ